MSPIDLLHRAIVDRQNLGLLLFNARRSARVTQRLMATRLGVSRSTIGRWERGHAVPALADLRRFWAACCDSAKSGLRTSPPGPE